MSVPIHVDIVVGFLPVDCRFELAFVRFLDQHVEERYRVFLFSFRCDFCIVAVEFLKYGLS